VFYGISLISLTISLKRLDVSVAYAIWAGLGVALISIVGITLFHEPMNSWKLVSLMFIIIGVVGLNLAGNMH
jgi:small multidrug resistance pump